jgi:hypothetical protein
VSMNMLGAHLVDTFRTFVTRCILNVLLWI